MVQRWRSYVCDVAAAYAIGLLQSGPVPHSPTVAPNDLLRKHSIVPPIYAVPLDRYDALKRKYDLTEAALNSFFEILRKNMVPPEKRDHELRQIAERFNILHAELDRQESHNSRVLMFRRQALESLDRGDFDCAEKFIRQAIESDEKAEKRIIDDLRNRHRSRACSLADLGQLKFTQLAYKQAIDYFQQAIDLVLGSDERILSDYLIRLGDVLSDIGQYVEAEPLYQRSLKIRERLLGPKHSDVAISLNKVAFILENKGKYTEAIPLVNQAIAILESQKHHQHYEVEIAACLF